MSASAERHQPSLSTAGYLDGLGRRTLRFDRQVGGMLQALELRPEFSLYETLLRDSAARLAGVKDPRIAGTLSIEREGHGLVVCSPLAGGDRLEELLETRSAEEDPAPGIDAALGFLVRVIPAVALLHRAGVVHGILAPGRLALTSSGDVVLLDCIYAAAIERVRLSRQRLWASLRVAAAVTPGATRFDRGTDVRQVALSAVAIALGRTLEEPCTPQVIGRLLQELAEVAQIRAGEGFATELRSLLDKASRLDQPTPPGLEETGAEAQRLARMLGTEACLAALTELAGTRVSSSEIGSVLPAIATPLQPIQSLQPLRSDPPVPIEPAAAEGPSPEPELSLDVTDTVEISLDAPGSLDFEAADEPSVLVLDASEEEAALFDWEPDRAGIARRPAPQELPILDFAAEGHTPEDTIRASEVPAALDWTPQAEAACGEDAAAVTAADVVPWQLEVRPAPVFAEPPVSVEPALSSLETAPISMESQPIAVEPPPLAMEPPPVVAEQAPVSAVDVTAAPAPPPGIPLFRRASPSPARPAPAPVSAPPSGQDERRGLKLYVPPPVPAAPPAPPAPAASMVFAAPAPAPVVVVAHAPPASVPLRIKDDPAPAPRPRRMLDTFDEQAQDDERSTGHAGEAPPRSLWKLVAAATVVLAVGAFAGLPFVAHGPEPAAAEAASVTAPPPPRTEAPVTASTGGGLHIETQPSGAAVLLDGEDVGRTPLKLEDVKPGRHVITLSTDSTTVKRTVRIEAGHTVTLDVPVYSGWVAVYSPVPLHISEGARMLGTTETTRVMLSPGRHELTLTNRELGYTTRQSVDIVAGEERVLNIEPRGSVSVNALPWAEVFVDGTRMGETPLANLDVPLGTREFVFKHPTYGERRITITITSTSPPLSVDFTRPGTRP